jgi:hypothetical protein
LALIHAHRQSLTLSPGTVEDIYDKVEEIAESGLDTEVVTTLFRRIGELAGGGEEAGAEAGAEGEGGWTGGLRGDMAAVCANIAGIGQGMQEEYDPRCREVRAGRRQGRPPSLQGRPPSPQGRPPSLQGRPPSLGEAPPLLPVPVSR